MKLYTIEHNVHAKIKKLLFLSVYLIIAFIYILQKYYNVNFNIYKWIAIIYCIIWIIYNILLYIGLFKIYKIKGYCIFKKEEIILKENEFEIIYNLKDIEIINFYYGGYDKELYYLDFLFTGSNYTFGTNNYLTIYYNGKKELQLFIKNEEEAKFIKSYFEDIKTIVIKSSFKKKFNI